MEGQFRSRSYDPEILFFFWFAKFGNKDRYLFGLPDGGICQFCLKRLFYSRFELLKVRSLGNLYFDLAMSPLHCAPQARLKYTQLTVVRQSLLNTTELGDARTEWQLPTTASPRLKIDQSERDDSGTHKTFRRA